MKYKIVTVNRLCRNANVGDYYVDGYPDWWDVEVTDTGNSKYNKLLAIHELVECMLIDEHGIPEYKIDEFDSQFTGNGEPGDAEGSPYKSEHQHAEFVEKYLAKAFGINWDEYSKAIEGVIAKHESEK